MAIAVGSVSNTPTLASRTNSTITAPTGITNGDLLVAVLHVGNTGAAALTVTPPSGFTAVTNSPSTHRKANDNYNISTHVFRKVASSEAGNYTFTHTTADTEGYMYRLTGADTTTPIDVNPAVQNAVAPSNGSTTTYPTLTTVTNGAFIIFAESDWDGPGTASPTGTTPTISVRRQGSITWIGDGTLATAGATGARTRANINGNGTTLVTYAPWTSIVVAIRPAASGGTVFNDSVTEAATATESDSAVATFAVSRSEAGTATDSPSSTAVFSASNTETATATDTEGGGYTVSQSEATSATDTPAASVVFPVSATETATATDTTAASAVFAAAATEAASASDASSTGFSDSITEAATATDSPSAAAVMGASAAETATATDAPAALAVFATSTIEVATATDTTDTATIYFVSVSESATATDTSNGSIGPFPPASAEVQSFSFIANVGSLMGR